MRLRPKNRHVKVLIQEFEGNALIEPNKHHSKMIMLYETTPAEVEQKIMNFLKNSGEIEEFNAIKKVQGIGKKKRRHYRHTKEYKEKQKMKKEVVIYRERNGGDEAVRFDKPKGFNRVCKICKQGTPTSNGMCHKCYNREAWRKHHWQGYKRHTMVK